MNTNTLPILIVAACLCTVAAGPNASAVLPPPDGGYPGFNTAVGQNALFSLTTGVANTANGWYSLWSNTDGSFNTAVGAGTLVLNVGDPSTFSGIDNTAVGAAALLLNTTGTYNTAVGTAALTNNNDGYTNTAVGAFALNSNTTGRFNAASGAFALENNTSGDDNSATGNSALNGNTSGEQNTATGISALLMNSTGNRNTAMGTFALQNSTGNDNTALGDTAGLHVTTANNVICIGANVRGEDVSNSCYIGQIFGQTSSGGTAVFINSTGRLGTLTSSRRFKEEIKPMDLASESLFSLKPVTFHYKRTIDPAGASQFGLVAEEVEKINSDLVVRDKEGKPYSVRYDQVNAMLLNEFLKEHRTVQKLKEEIAALTATLKEHAARIDKVSTEVRGDRFASQIVFNRP